MGRKTSRFHDRQSWELTTSAIVSCHHHPSNGWMPAGVPESAYTLVQPHAYMYMVCLNIIHATAYLPTPASPCDSSVTL